MTFILNRFDALLATFDGHSGDHSKCLSELAMALHYVRRDLPPDLLDHAAIERLEDEIHARIHQDGWLRMITNEFVLHQCATPYIFLKDSPRAGRLRSAVYEGLIDDLAAEDRMVCETTPYRRLERQWLLARLGRAELPDWRGAPVLQDARRAYGFDRMMAYAFTHVVFFASDFGARPLRDPHIKGAAMILAVQAEARDDVDLFWECAICLADQPLDPGELAGLVHLLARTRDKHSFLFDPKLAGTGLREAYHPMLVHDILRGRMLARFGIDILTAPAGDGPGPFAALAELANALARKDADKILRAWKDCPQEDWLQDMVRRRLTALRALCERGVLFARELAALGTADGATALHLDYAQQIGRMIDEDLRPVA